jgi:hypothetical protein
MLVDGAGAVLAQAPIPAMPAPADLLPVTRTVRLRIPASSNRQGLTVRIALPGGAAEVTQMNNSAPVPAQP